MQRRGGCPAFWEGLCTSETPRGLGCRADPTELGRQRGHPCVPVLGNEYLAAGRDPGPGPLRPARQQRLKPQPRLLHVGTTAPHVPSSAHRECHRRPPHGAGTHSIEGKQWQEKARHLRVIFEKKIALMVTKWDSYRTLHFINRHQNFFRATRGRLAGRSMEHSKRHWLRFGCRAGCHNFRAFFRATLKLSRRFLIEFCYALREQCCPPIYLTSAKQ